MHRKGQSRFSVLSVLELRFASELPGGQSEKGDMPRTVEDHFVQEKMLQFQKGRKPFWAPCAKRAPMELMNGTPRGFGSHLGLRSQQDGDLRGWACAGNAPRRQSRVAAGVLSKPGPAPCMGKPLPFSGLVSSSGEWDGNKHHASIPRRSTELHG